MTTRDTAPPNVLVFFTDQQRWDTTGLHGNPLNLTPNFDRLARGGTHLSHTFTCQPVCGPARSCLQTGQYATTTGCYRNGIPLPKDAHTLAHHFREAGYTTAYIGKWHLAESDPVPADSRGGYEDWLASNALEFSSDAYRTELFDRNGHRVRLPGYRVDALTDAMIRHLATPHDKPFFLFTSFLEPHHQNHLDNYPAPHGYEERYAGQWTPPDLAALTGSAPQHLGGYFGMVRRLDEALGRVVDALISLGLRENTILLFTSDHGCHFKTRNDEYKRSCHESSIRVPTFLTGPGFEGGGQIQDLVSLIDFPPTLLDAAGIPAPKEMQGHSIMPLIKKTSSDWLQEVFIQISESQVGRALRTRRWKYGVVAPDRDAMRDAQSDHYAEDCLYDLEADPHELTNLAGSHAYREISRQLAERLIQRMTAAGEPAPTITPTSDRPSGQRCPSLFADGSECRQE